MRKLSRSLTASVLLVVAWTGFSAAPASAGPAGQMTLAVTVSIAPRWFDPAEAEGIITPLMESAILNGYGPRVEESGIGLITNMAGSVPYEELRLKGK